MSCLVGHGILSRFTHNFILEFSKVIKRTFQLFISGKCTYKVGDGIGGEEEFIGLMNSANSCADFCIVKAKKDPGINGASFSAASKKCFCEKGMTGRNADIKYTSCLFGFWFEKSAYVHYNLFSDYMYFIHFIQVLPIGKKHVGRIKSKLLTI